jgi:hypothetical protein
LAGNESRWRLREGRLEFLDAYDRRSTVFDEVYADADGRLAFVGLFQVPGERRHLLKETPLLDELASPDGAPELIRRDDRPPRRNLVLIRAGEASLHRRWPRNLAEADRSWDLCVSWYGEESGFAAETEAEIRVLQSGTRQYQALHQLLHRDSPLWAYDYIAMPDDDIMASWRDWNALFAICRKHQLLLAQPALAPEGYITHPITAQDPRYTLRFTSFVEVMTPIFSREALQACIGTFGRAVSGFGLDNIWPKLLGEPRDRIAVIDAVPVVHTRPQGGSYSIEAALAEGAVLQDAYGSPSRLLEWGGLFAEPMDRERIFDDQITSSAP